MSSFIFDTLTYIKIYGSSLFKIILNQSVKRTEQQTPTLAPSGNITADEASKDINNLFSNTEKLTNLNIKKIDFEFANRT